ncbi:MAG TPA: hypothetical protein VG297_00745 [Bryobacteraceae bacterium]|nr:hypothetical protein [Bryobacteraceae bacterium]
MKLTAVVVTALSSLGLLSAATPGIGIAMSQGNIIINSSQTAGNATIFDGSTLETTAASSQVRLNGGAQLRLASESRGTVYTDHVNLERGSARIAGYSANANGLNVRADGSSSATVSMRDQGVVEIAALTGNVHVFNAAGMTVANLLPGRALDLRPQDAGASAPSTLTGCAASAGGNTLFTDEASNVTVQLRGNAVRAGRRVQISGTMVPNATPTSPATQVMNVTSVKNVGGACKAGTAAAAGGAAAGAGGGAAGAATGVSTTTAVIAGVAAAAAVGTGIGVAETSSSNPTVSSGRLGAFN